MKKSLPKKPTARKPQSGPGLFLCHNGDRSFYSATEPGSIAALQKRLREVPGSSAVPRLEFQLVHRWSDEFTWNVFNLLVSCKLVFEVAAMRGGATHRTILDAVLSLVGTCAGDIKAERQVRQAACIAASLEFPGCESDAADRILMRCKQVQVSCPTKRELKSMIGGLSGGGLLTAGPAMALAQGFVASLVPVRVSDEDRRVPGLIFFKQEWYKYTGSGWVCLGKHIRHQLTDYAQRHGACGRDIGAKLIADAVVNLEGLCHRDFGQMEMPVWLDEGRGGNRALHVLCCKNGLLDLGPVLRGEGDAVLVPHTPRYFSVNQLEFDYDPEAKCPRWTRAISQMLPRRVEGDKRRQVLQEFAGWCFCSTGLRLEKFLVLFGPGGNGKSVILELLEHVLGSENVSHLALEELSGEFKLHPLVGKLANFAGDMNRIDKFEEGLLKKLISGDGVEVNRKGISMISVRFRVKFIYATNVMPNIHDRSNAMNRRIIILPMDVVFDDFHANRNLIEELKEEASGIANWCLRGLARLVRQQNFTQCEVCKQAADEHRVDNDPFLQFVEEECRLGERQEVRKEALYQRYSTWCEENGRKPTASAEFYRRVRTLAGVTICRPGGGNSRPYRFRGISVAGTFNPFTDIPQDG